MGMASPTLVRERVCEGPEADKALSGHVETTLALVVGVFRIYPIPQGRFAVHEGKVAFQDSLNTFIKASHILKPLLHLQAIMSN